MKGLKLWEKNYILTLGICYIILFGGIFFILQFSFRQNLQRESTRILESQERFFFILSNMMKEGTDEDKLARYCQTLKEREIYISVSIENMVVVDFLPVSVRLPAEAENPKKEKKRFCFLKDGGKRYAYLEKSFLNSLKANVNIAYMENISIVYDNQRKNTIVFLFTAFLVAVLLAAFFYYSLKKIYYPVSNIAHELKTPLTAIQGYAQYILLGKITQEDIAYASSQIDREAKYINDLVERILIMGNLRDNAISMEWVHTGDLESFIKKHYPSVKTEIFTDTLYGDQTLLESLLSNLLSNACRYGKEITVFFKENEICICNRGDYIDKRKLRILNGNRSMPEDMVDGKGLGVPLCHEIARLHHGRLQYYNGKEGVEITFFCRKA